MPGSLRKEISELTSRRQQALEKLIPLARTAANILRDLGQPSTATQLEAQLFALDSADADLVSILNRDPKAALMELLDQMKSS